MHSKSVDTVGGRTNKRYVWEGTNNQLSLAHALPHSLSIIDETAPTDCIPTKGVFSVVSDCQDCFLALTDSV